MTIAIIISIIARNNNNLIVAILSLSSMSCPH